MKRRYVMVTKSHEGILGGLKRAFESATHAKSREFDRCINILHSNGNYMIKTADKLVTMDEGKETLKLLEEMLPFAKDMVLVMKEAIKYNKTVIK